MLGGLLILGERPLAGLHLEVACEGCLEADRRCGFRERGARMLEVIEGLLCLGAGPKPLTPEALAIDGHGEAPALVALTAVVPGSLPDLTPAHSRAFWRIHQS